MSAYPLKQVLEVKLKRQEEAERIAQEKRVALEAEQKKLRDAEAKRNEAMNLYKDKLTQLRKALDEGGVNSSEILQMKEFLKICKERVAKEEALVKEQKAKVDQAQEALNAALVVVKQRRLEVDKINIHKEEWTKETVKEERRQEEKTEEDIGTTMYYGKEKDKNR